jgi:hypothetical protein
MLLIPLKHVGRGNHFAFQPLQLSNITIFSYHLMLQVWYNPWIRKELIHSKFTIRINFWNGFSLSLNLLLLTKLEENSA